jgi:hypothetical protein
VKRHTTGAQIVSAGLVGLNKELFHIEEISPNWEKGTVRLNMTDVNYLANGPWQIAPDDAPVWTSGGAATKNIYIASQATGNYSDGTAGRPLYP